jgi:hypothetical protein
MKRTRREVIESHLLSQEVDVDRTVRRVLQIDLRERRRGAPDDGGVSIEVVRNWFARFLEQPQDVLIITVPFAPGSVNEDDEVYSLMRLAYEGGASIVVAAGDFGGGLNTLNPLALSPWVMSAAAASHDGRTLADFSSRGVPGSDLDAPTFAAPGIDVIDGWPEGEPKSKERERRDREKVTPERLYQQIGRAARLGPEDLSKLTVSSGTSYAATLLGGIVARLIQMRRTLGLPARPQHIREVLRQAAAPMPGYGPHEVGAGFVGVLTVTEYFDSLDSSEGNGSGPLWGGSTRLGELWQESQGAGVTIAVFSPQVPEPEPGQRVRVSDDGKVTEFSNVEDLTEDSADKVNWDLYLPAPHPDANPEEATRLNIEYQERLKQWQALPWWKRLFTKKPVSPMESLFE